MSMDDQELDERLLRAAKAHNEPPETPREAMWEAIQRQRRPPTEVRRLPRRWTGRPWLPLAAAAAAILAVGIGIGRVTSVTTPATVAAGPKAQPAGSEAAYRLATTEHLGQSEEFLTLFRSTVGRTGDHQLASATARRLLTTNRLLLDSPAAVDRRTRLLLEDLELVLAGIAQLSPHSPAEDVDLIREGIERGDVMPRLRTAVPSGAVPFQGAL
jgi:hypothetical protein